MTSRLTPLLLAVAAGLGGYLYGTLGRGPAPDSDATTVVVKETPSVLLALREVARLEGAVAHVERVIDLTEKQSRFYGLIQAEDAILLVAVGEVTAGVDLAELGEEDVVADPVARRVSITLPAPRVLSRRLDTERTYVHTRRTDLLARREEQLETRARQEAERTLEAAALEGGLLDRAELSARRTVEALARSLGFAEVEVKVRAARPAEKG